MKKQIMLTLVVSAVFLASGCSIDGLPSYGEQVVVAETKAQRQTDAHILGSVVVINKNEIAAASVAEKRATNPAVKDYAQFLYNAHTQNLQETESLSQKINITPKRGHTAVTLASHGNHELSALRHVKVSAFDRDFINDMVKDHTAALQLFDTQLLKQATNPALRRQLEATRTHIANHLQRGKEIQNEMSQNGHSR